MRAGVGLPTTSKLYDFRFKVRRSEFPIQRSMFCPHDLSIMSKNHLRTVSHLQAYPCSIMALREPV